MTTSEKVRDLWNHLFQATEEELHALADEVAELEQRTLPEGYGYGCVSDGGSEIDLDAGKFRSRYMDDGGLYESGWRETAEEALQESLALAAEAAKEKTA